MTDIDTVAEAMYDSLYVNPTLPKPLPFGELYPEDAERFRRMAQAAIDALQLTQEWGAAYAHDDLVTGDGDFIRGEIENFGGSLVSRYVTDWVTDRSRA